ncbi:MAG: DEAD/DEAH box helicase, partial [Kiritimatiellae bacterium]|nr:DEAD/DEAH box helicase [Kiritimatiellia bacterium]
MAAIADLGFKYCTPIQAASLEQTMAGQNVAGRAQTGTGKTAAYLVAILTRYLRSPDRRNSAPATPRALVIAPTRELCVQICLDAQALGKYCGLNSVAIYGGMDYARQQSILSENVIDLVAATPGRLLDFARHHVIDLSKIDTLVIDEADRMLDMGFIPDVRRI